jgi:hypothetical protein
VFPRADSPLLPGHQKAGIGCLNNIVAHAFVRGHPLDHGIVHLPEPTGFDTLLGRAQAFHTLKRRSPAPSLTRMFFSEVPIDYALCFLGAVPHINTFQILPGKPKTADLTLEQSNLVAPDSSHVIRRIADRECL